MAVPKRKTSKARRDKRRTHQKTTGPQLMSCPECGEVKAPHRACAECGAYREHNVHQDEE